MSEKNLPAISNQSSVVESVVSGGDSSSEEDFVDYYYQQDELADGTHVCVVCACAASQ